MLFRSKELLHIFDKFVVLIVRQMIYVQFAFRWLFNYKLVVLISIPLLPVTTLQNTCLFNGFETTKARMAVVSFGSINYQNVVLLNFFNFF